MPPIDVQPDGLVSPSRVLQAVSDEIAAVVARLAGPMAGLDARTGAAAGTAARANEALRDGLQRIGLGYHTFRLALDDAAAAWTHLDTNLIKPAEAPAQ